MAAPNAFSPHGISSIEEDGAGNLWIGTFGSGFGKFDGSGRYRTTFVLAGKVPPGTAYLSVASARGSQLVQARTTFVIKPLTQPCS